MIRKVLLIFALVSMSLVSKADEGMWTFFTLPDAVYKQMQAEGCKLTLDQLRNNIAGSVVNFCGYCTGEVVSPQGLVFTNHHCGFEAIRSHSSVEHDYMLNGFYAKTLADELSNEDLFVSFMKDQRDITPMLDSLGIKKMERMEQEHLIDSINEDLTKKAKAIDSTYYVEIDPFYEGNSYYATTYQRFSDVRLVYAPTKSMGKFGGETDNWMWPRQTCDISVFRIYVNPKDGRPAAYSKDNVPYGQDSLSLAQHKIPHYLPVSMDGYEIGSYAMTVGYPGSTNRYLSSYGIKSLRDCMYKPMHQVRDVKQAVMKKYMHESEAVRIKYDSKFATSANYWKNAVGMIKCIDSIGLIQQKAQYEQRIQAYADSIGIPLDMKKLQSLYQKNSVSYLPYTLFSESFGRRSQNELSHRANKYFNGMEVKGDLKNPKKQYFVFTDNSDQWDRILDCEALAVLMKNYREQINTLRAQGSLSPVQAKQFLPDFYKTIDKDFGGDYREYVYEMWNTTCLMKSGEKLSAKPTKKMKKDLGIQYGMSLLETLADIRLGMDSIQDSIQEQERLLCLAKIRMEQDMPHYSDANFTMRLSYGQVGGYLLGGFDSGYYTTAASIVKKMAMGDKCEDYKAENELMELMSTQDFGPYTDSVSKTLNLCFLTNNDITGGNSGSPVIDGNGHLIGLAFDGNWDSLADDIHFDKVLARCICVDVRYILYLMDKWAHADRLLDELEVKN